MTVTDKTLSGIFSKFGAGSAIIVDRQQSMVQQKWIRHKQRELRQKQQDELEETIERLRSNLTRNMMNDYKVKSIEICFA